MQTAEVFFFFFFFLSDLIKPAGEESTEQQEGAGRGSWVCVQGKVEEVCASGGKTKGGTLIKHW